METTLIYNSIKIRRLRLDELSQVLRPDDSIWCVLTCQGELDDDVELPDILRLLEPLRRIEVRLGDSVLLSGKLVKHFGPSVAMAERNGKTRVLFKAEFEAV